MRKLDLTLTDSTNIALFSSGTINFLQTSWQEGFGDVIVNSIVQVIGNNYSISTVYVLYGCELSVIAGNNVISEGVIFYNLEFYRCPQTILSGTIGTIIGNLLITPYTTSYGGDPMNFTISGTANVHNIRTVQFVYGTSGTGTLTGGGTSDYTALNFYNKYAQLGTSFNSLVVSTPAGQGTVTGTLYYRKNFIDNTLTIYGTLTANSAQDFNAFPNTSYYIAGTLPTGFYPSTSTQHTTGYYFISHSILDSTGTQYIDKFDVGINTAGQIFVKWVKPDIIIAGYGINISAIISLY